MTPRYAVGFAAERELPIIWKIALGSLKNKLLFLLPAALVLSLIAPWAITPLLMAGVAYTVGEQPVLVSFSIVAGPSFNDLDFHDDFLSRLPAGQPQPDLDAKNSFAVRPGVGLTWTVAPRVAIIGFAGYSINRPDVVYRNPAGVEYRNRWKADAVLLSVGAVYSIF